MRRVPHTPILRVGGVLAQATVALPLIACVEIFGYTRFPPLNAALAILDFFSSTTAAFNLLPIRPLDASIAWRLLPASTPQARRVYYGAVSSSRRKFRSKGDAVLRSIR